MFWSFGPPDRISTRQTPRRRDARLFRAALRPGARRRAHSRRLARFRLGGGYRRARLHDGARHGRHVNRSADYISDQTRAMPSADTSYHGPLRAAVGCCLRVLRIGPSFRCNPAQPATEFKPATEFSQGAMSPGAFSHGEISVLPRIPPAPLSPLLRTHL